MKLSRILTGILLIFLFILGIVCVAYGQYAEYDEVPKARFSFFHAAPNTPPVDIVINDEVKFGSISFNGKTEFEFVDAGEYTISINEAGTGNVILGPVKASLKQGRDHILFITGFVDKEPELDAKLLVKKTRPAYFRFYHTAPDVDNVSVILNGNTYWQSGVDYGKPTKYEKINFGSLEFIIKQGEEVIVGPIKVDFKPGKTYTIVLVGTSAGSGGTKLQLKVIEED